jgi:aspartate-semialdehyde dehydrogenase
MENKIKVGIIGATGAVGQNYAVLLENHPQFEITYLGASEKSAGKTFLQATQDRWFMDKPLPRNLEKIIVENGSNPETALTRCDFVFSSYEGTAEEIRATEVKYASLGIPVISNNSAHRTTQDVPMIIPEINSSHTKLIDIQRKLRGWDKGFIVAKPNCSIQSFMIPIYALLKEGYFPERLNIVTMQAISGAGYPGVSSLDILDNVIPYIKGEEEKTEKEPLKILGTLQDEKIVSYDLKINAQCNRVQVRDGHLACVNLNWKDETDAPSTEEIKDIWHNFSSQESSNLYSSPKRPIIYLEEQMGWQ